MEAARARGHHGFTDVDNGPDGPGAGDMAIDPNAMNEPHFDASDASLKADAADEDIGCIGYECADPALHAPFWAEAGDASSTRDLR